MSTSEGLDLNDIDQTSPEEVDDALIHVWSWRGPLYEMYATSLQLDYAPDFGKISRWASDIFGRPAGERAVVLQSCQNIHSYMMLGWETGIRNEFETLRRNGMSKEQVLELVMFTQLYAGMRGLGHVYHAVGDPRRVQGRPGPEHPRADRARYGQHHRLVRAYDRVCSDLDNFRNQVQPEIHQAQPGPLGADTQDSAQTAGTVPDAAPSYDYAVGGRT
jgi:hypothetical protein